MKRILLIAAALCVLALAASCIDSPVAPPPPATTDADYELELSFDMGVASDYANIYVAWIEDSSRSFIRYIHICERLDYLAFTGSSSYSNIRNKATCPYWRKGLYETSLDDELLDGVSGATVRNNDFSNTITLPAGSPSRFTVYFEIDRSYDDNDWWDDQPAILYAADVDASGAEATLEFELTPRGWARNAGGGSGGNVNEIPGNPQASAIGALQSEMRYITHHAASDGTAFGDPYGTEANPDDSTKDATKMVDSITLTATRQ